MIFTVQWYFLLHQFFSHTNYDFHDIMSLPWIIVILPIFVYPSECWKIIENQLQLNSDMLSELGTSHKQYGLHKKSSAWWFSEWYNIQLSQLRVSESLSKQYDSLGSQMRVLRVLWIVGLCKIQFYDIYNIMILYPGWNPSLYWETTVVTLLILCEKFINQPWCSLIIWKNGISKMQQSSKLIVKMRGCHSRYKLLLPSYEVLMIKVNF